MSTGEESSPEGSQNGEETGSAGFEATGRNLFLLSSFTRLFRLRSNRHQYLGCLTSCSNTFPNYYPTQDTAHPTILSQVFSALRAIILSSWLNALLPIVPVAIISYLTHANVFVIFTTNVVAVVPLSGLLTYATESISRESGDVVGALLNVTFGNLVEIVLFAALYHNQLEVVQASILGSVLVNLLLILGMAILAGSICRQEQMHNKDEAQALACLLSVSVFSLLIPAAFYHSFNDTEIAEKAVLTLSRVSSLAFLAIYLLYIILQMRKIPTPSSLEVFTERSPSESMSRSSVDLRPSAPLLFHRSIRFQDEELPDDEAHDHARKESVELGSFSTSPHPEAHTNVEDNLSYGEVTDEEEFDRGRQPVKATSDLKKPSKNSIYQNQYRARFSGSRNSHHRGLSQESQRSDSRRVSFAGSTTSLPRILLRSSASSPELSVYDENQQDGFQTLGRKTSMVLLIISSLLVAVCAEFLVNTLDDIVSSGPFSQSFIGLIILPVAGNCAELITATTVAARGKFDLAIGVSIGSSIQIALFVTPLVVIAGWFVDRDMTMYFGLFETVALVATTFLVNFLIMNRRANFLEGSLLCACYLVIGVGSYLFPDPENQPGDPLRFAR